jgi:hypothetical protein
LFNAPVGQIFPISPRFETQWAAVSSAGPREIASSASFWLLLKRAPRLVNPTFNQIVRRLCRYCYDVPSQAPGFFFTDLPVNQQIG